MKTSKILNYLIKNQHIVSNYCINRGMKLIIYQKKEKKKMIENVMINWKIVKENNLLKKSKDNNNNSNSKRENK